MGNSRRSAGALVDFGKGALTLSLALALSACGARNQSFFSGELPLTARVCNAVIGDVDPVERLDLRWKWAAGPDPEFNQNMATPMVADVNGDGVSDFVFSAFKGNAYGDVGVLRVVSGKDGAELWSTGKSADVRPLGSAAPAIYDLDRDGKPEVLVAAKRMSDAKFGVAIYRANGQLLGFTPLSASMTAVSAIAVADVDGDGKPEVTVGMPSGSMATLDLATWKLGAVRAQNVLGTMDLDPKSPGLEIVTTTAVYAADGATKLYDLPAGRNSIASPQGIGFGNFDGKPGADFVLVRPTPLTVQTIDGATGALLSEWVEPAADQAECTARKGAPVSISGAPNVGDVDGDGWVDVTFAGACRFYALRNTKTEGLTQQWSLVTRDFSSARTGSSIYDFNGDGRVEALYNDELFFRILDGRTGQVLYALPNDNGTLWENPVVASLRPGEPASIVISANSYTGYSAKYNPGVSEDPLGAGDVTGIRVIQGGKNLWMPTRTLWNQHLYTITNVLDSLQLPPLGFDFASFGNRTRANLPDIAHPCQ